MTSIHEGLSCDSCRKNNFKGLRYKCLVCYDYDLCSTCYEAGLTSSRHTISHPMQCIIAKNDYDLFYSGETIANDQPQSLTCPLCGNLGFTESSLLDHVTLEHSNSESDESSAGVVCPICGFETNQLIYDFVTHLTMEHRAPRDATEQVSIRGRGARCHARASGPRGRRSQLHYSTVGSGSSGVANSSPVTDPLVEIIAQLSGVGVVRRPMGGVSSGNGGGSGSASASMGNSNQSPASQLHQLQMQLQSSPPFASRRANDQEVRIMRRTFQTMSNQMNSTSTTSTSTSICGPTSAPGSVTASAAFCGSNPAFASLIDHRHPFVNNHSSSSSGLGTIGSLYANGIQQAALNGLGGGVSGSAAGGVLSGQLPGDGSAASSGPQSQYLLPRCMNPIPTEAEQQQREILKADRSLFVQELLLQVGSIEKNK